MIQRISLYAILIFLISTQKKIEKCLRKALYNTETTYLQLQDITYIANLMTDPIIINYNKSTIGENCLERYLEPNFLCKKKNPSNCERCGHSLVEKCNKGYITVDCGLCVKKCPEGTLPDAVGALCIKPKTKRRPLFDSLSTCISNSLDCIKIGTQYAGLCPHGFESLGNYLCSYKCPPEFIDDGIYCIPPRQIRTEYFIGDLNKTELQNIERE